MDNKLHSDTFSVHLDHKSQVRSVRAHIVHKHSRLSRQWVHFSRRERAYVYRRFSPQVVYTLSSKEVEIQLPWTHVTHRTTGCAMRMSRS